MMNGPTKKHSFSSSRGKGRKTDKVGANQGGARREGGGCVSRWKVKSRWGVGTRTSCGRSCTDGDKLTFDVNAAAYIRGHTGRDTDDDQRSHTKNYGQFILPTFFLLSKS